MSGHNTNTTHTTGPLPVDSDVDTLGNRNQPRPIHLHPGYVALVVIGGLLGTLARYGLEATLPTPGGWPLPTLLINLAGALALGMLLEGLARRGHDTGRLRIIRLLVGTGFIGAFTTYSTLALEANLLLDNHRISAALLYLLASLIGGLCATTAGIWAAARHHRSVIVRARRSLPEAPSDGGW